MVASRDSFFEHQDFQTLISSEKAGSIYFLFESNKLIYVGKSLTVLNRIRSHTDVRFTDTQREKMFGSSVQVQKDTYVKLQAEQLRGMETILDAQISKNVQWGKSGENSVLLGFGQISSARS